MCPEIQTSPAVEKLTAERELLGETGRFLVSPLQTQQKQNWIFAFYRMMTQFYKALWCYKMLRSFTTGN